MKVGHIDDWTRLLGTTNTQGRLINGSVDPCEIAATSATGQFVHIEQSRIGLRDTLQNWMKLAQAIADAVPENASAVLILHQMYAARILGIYPNPFESRTQIDFELDHSAPIQLEVFDVIGRRLATLYSGNRSAGIGNLVWDTGRMTSGIYFIHLRQMR